MKTNLILIEGLPGSGKTTYANKVKQYLADLEKEVISFTEGDLHPIDLAWCAITKDNELQDILNKFPHLKEEILKQTKKVKNENITAYTRVRIKSEEDFKMFDEFDKYEIYRTNDIEHFKNKHYELWEDFNNTYDENKIYVFECVFLQNHINELILKFNKDLDYTIDYFTNLINKVSNLNPTLIYLHQEDISYTLDMISNQRKSDTPQRKDWIDLVKDYLSSKPTAEELGFVGDKAVYNYFKHRQELQDKVFEKLEINKKMFNINKDYDLVFEEIKSFLSN